MDLKMSFIDRMSGDNTQCYPLIFKSFMNAVYPSIVVLPFLSTLASAVVIYDESISGDLSGTFASPTPLVLSAGNNTIIGEVGNNGNTGATNGSDADYFSFTLNDGLSLESIQVDSYSSSPGSSGGSFAGYVEGSSFSGQGGGDIDGFVIFNAGSGEILDDLSGGSLNAGTYAFWFQETSPNTVSYQLTFNVVPEPSTATLSAMGICALVLRRRR